MTRITTIIMTTIIITITIEQETGEFSGYCS